MKYLTSLILSMLLSAASWASSPVNVNSASAEEIAEALKGVGLAKAQAIVAYRESNGQFEFIDELVNVKGIGIRTVDMNRDRILLSDPAAGSEQ